MNNEEKKKSGIKILICNFMLNKIVCENLSITKLEIQF